MRLRAIFRSGVPLIALGLLFALVGDHFLPTLVSWLFALLLVGVGVKSLLRTPGFRGGLKGWRFQDSQPPPGAKLRPGEAFERSVQLSMVPNVPLAEMVCSELRTYGIESYYTAASTFGGDGLGIADLNPALPVYIWVGEHDRERARRIMDELDPKVDASIG